MPVFSCCMLGTNAFACQVGTCSPQLAQIMIAKPRSEQQDGSFFERHTQTPPRRASTHKQSHTQADTHTDDAGLHELPPMTASYSTRSSEPHTPQPTQPAHRAKEAVQASAQRESKRFVCQNATASERASGVVHSVLLRRAAQRRAAQGRAGCTSKPQPSTPPQASAHQGPPDTMITVL